MDINRNTSRNCVNLEKLEGRFSVDNTIDRASVECHSDHAAEYQDLATVSVSVDSAWCQWQEEVAKYPWKSLKILDLNGRMSLKVSQY